MGFATLCTRRLGICILFLMVTLVLFVAEEKKAAAKGLHTMVFGTTCYLMGERVAGTSSHIRLTFLDVSVWAVYILIFLFTVVTITLLDIDKVYEPTCALAVWSCGILYAGAKVALVNLLVERLRIIRNSYVEAVSRWKDRFYLVMMGFMSPYAIVGAVFVANLIWRVNTGECRIGVAQDGLWGMMVYNSLFLFMTTACYVRELHLLRKMADSEKSASIRISLRGISPLASAIACVIFTVFSVLNLSSFIASSVQHYRMCLTLCIVDQLIGMLVTDYMSGLLADMEKVRMDAEEALHAFAVMDLERVEYLEKLPRTSIQRSLGRMVSLLRNVRQFIPDSYLASLQTDNGEEITGMHMVPVIRMTAPGTVTNSAAIVFSDIVKSTILWEACPEGMSKGLRLHNSIIRALIAEHDGYEVKTVGDAFMVAFDTAAQGIRFGLKVQEALCAAAWPADLMEVMLGQEKLGLKIRIGVNAGPIEVEQNVITGRSDYFGTTVNVAARLEAAAPPAAVCTTMRLYEQLQEEGAVNVTSLQMGAVSLKGVAEPLALVALLAPGLSDKWLQYALAHDATRLATHSGRSRVSSVATVSSSSTLEAMYNVPKDVDSKVGTVAHIDVQCVAANPVGSVNEKVVKIVNSTERSEGSILAVIGSSIVAGWNTARPNVSHVSNALNFVTLLHRNVAWEGHEHPVSIGVCTGMMHTGTLGAHGQRFITSIGMSVMCAQHLSQFAMGAGLFGTYSTVLSEEVPQKGSVSLMRPIARWVLRRRTDATKITVYELNTDSSLMEWDMCDNDNTPASRWGWSQEYWDAFTSGDVEAICDAVRGDTDLAKLVSAAPLLKDCI